MNSKKEKVAAKTGKQWTTSPQRLKADISRIPQEGNFCEWWDTLKYTLALHNFSPLFKKPEISLEDKNGGGLVFLKNQNGEEQEFVIHYEWKYFEDTDTLLVYSYVS